MDSYDNRLRFTYPVRPGSPQWAALPNRASRLAACEISPELLQRMNTENLLDAVLEHPYLSDVFAFDNVQKGLACLTEDIAAVRELLCRADAENVIRNRLKEIGCDAAANHLRAEMLRAFLGEDIVVTDDGTFCYARDPAGSNVEMIVKSEELTPAQKEATADDIRMNYPNVSILAPATKHFNCHSYAWHHTNEAWNRFWLNDPDPYWQDESYSPANRPSEGDIVYYGTKGFEHSGIVAKKTVRFSVSSQNGAMNVWRFMTLRIVRTIAMAERILSINTDYLKFEIIRASRANVILFALCLLVAPAPNPL